MKKIVELAAKFFCVLTVFSVCLAAGPAVVKAEGYTYQSASNTYLISSTQGDVTDAVREALAAAQGSAAAPAVIRLQPGSYQVANIDIRKSNVTLDFTGSVLKGTGTGNNMLRIADGAVSNVKIQGGKWQAAGTEKFAFFISGAKDSIRNLTLDGCEVSGAAETNIRIDAVDGLILRKIHVHDSGYGLLVLNSTDMKAQECIATKNNFGLAFRGASGTLTDAQAADNKQDGLQVKDKGADIAVNGGSFCRNGKNGISLTSGAKMTMTLVKVFDNQSNGISPVGAKGLDTVLTAKDVVFSGNGRHGVAADAYVTVSLTDCEANNNKANGVFLNNYSTGRKLENITAVGNGGSAQGGTGILIQNGSSCSKIEGCVCNSNKKLGISLDGVSTVLSNCSLQKNEKHGLFLTGKGKTKAKVTVKDCEIAENKNNGITALANNTVDVKNTNITDNGNCGIETTDCTVKVTGKGNVSSGNGKNGIVCRGGKLLVSKAVVENNKNYGVRFDGCAAGSYCIKSTIRGNLAGISITSGAVVNKVSGNVIANNRKYNMVLYVGQGKKKTTLKACAKNQFSVKKKAGCQIYLENKTKAPAKIKSTKGKAKKDKYGNTFAVSKKK